MEFLDDDAFTFNFSGDDRAQVGALGKRVEAEHVAQLALETRAGFLPSCFAVKAGEAVGFDAADFRVEILLQRLIFERGGGGANARSEGEKQGALEHATIVSGGVV